MGETPPKKDFTKEMKPKEFEAFIGNFGDTLINSYGQALQEGREQLAVASQEPKPADPASESKAELREKKQEALMNGEYTVPSGEHLVVEDVMESTITVSSGAKLTVENLMNSKVRIHVGGEAVIDT